MKALNNVVVKNFISLGAIQAANFLIPLITAPYVIRHIGIEKYGVVNVALAVAIFFNVLVDFSFNLTGTRAASLHRHDPVALGRIASTVMMTKAFILTTSFVMFSAMVFVVPAFSQEKLLYFMSFTMVIAQALLPSWFFQGIEEMKYITYLTLGGKVISILLIFTLVSVPADYLYINFISGVATIITSSYGYWMAFRRQKMTFMMPTMKQVTEELKGGWIIMVSNLSYGVYSFANIIILNFLVSDKALVGSYAVAEKVIIMIKQILGVFTQVVYPRVVALVNDGFDAFKSFLLKVYIPFLILIATGVVTLLFVAPWVIYFLVGSYDPTAIFLLRLIAPVPLIITLNIPFYQFLLAYDFRKAYSGVHIIGAFVSILVNFPLTYFYGATGTSITMIVSETFVMSLIAIRARNKYVRHVLMPVA